MVKMDTITDEKLQKYLNITKKGLEGIKIIVKDKELRKKAEDLLDMAQRYFSDAQYYAKKGDKVTSFAAINFAHGYLDAGARLGLFEVKEKSLFTIE